MTKPFRTQIHRALADANLQTALDNNAQRRTQVRLQSYASLPEDVQVMRQRAHNIRADVIAHLDQYLEQFIENVRQNGIIVHRAANAAEMVQIVLDISQQHNAHLIAKSKTMVGEEIELNPALEEHGYQVVETDLGEYIVQIRHEHPAHIITPAVHLRKEDVGKTFQELLGVPYTDDVATMVKVARRTLRDIFLKADIGISGVNFGVAENGTLCVLTNEGNGRMVTTVPPVHIALMGIERLAPTLDDLATLLYLLPRFATGQKLTVYANLIRKPAVDSDGAKERHLILLDNGRSAIRNSPYSEMLYCVRCGSCINACPVFREIGGHAYVGETGKHTPYPGPMGSVLAPMLFSRQEFSHLARASSLCGACKEACPVDIDLPKLLLRHRAGITVEKLTPPQKETSNAPGYLSLGLKFFRWGAVSPWLFNIAQSVIGIFSGCVKPMTSWMRLPAFTGWGYSKDFPLPGGMPFHSRWNKINEKYETSPSNNSAPADSAPKEETAQPAVVPPFESPVDQFSRELKAVGGEFIPCDSASVGQHILSLLEKNDIKAIQAWDAAFLPEGLLDKLQAQGIQVSHDPNPDLRAGLTGVLSAIAETGTLVIPGEAGRPLTASLLPDIHIAVLHAGDIQKSVLQALPSLRDHPSPVTILVSGPSRTADIEMTLSIGVHGPCRVVVFCLSD
jgi:L-lactate dehydrogenase complex protein LldF